MWVLNGIVPEEELGIGSAGGKAESHGLSTVEFTIRRLELA
jgi:hypothetical protein